MPGDQVEYLRGRFWALRRHREALRDRQFTLVRQAHQRYGYLLIRAQRINSRLLYRLFLHQLTRSQQAAQEVSRRIAETDRALEALQEQLVVHRLLRSCNILLA